MTTEVIRSTTYVPQHQGAPSKNETGKRFGTWIVTGVSIPPEGKDRPRGVYWACKCECGDTRAFRGTDIRRQRTGVRESVLCANKCREFGFLV